MTDLKVNESALKHWELDDELGSFVAKPDFTKSPSYVEADLEDVYGPDAPTQAPNPMNDPQDTGR